MSFLEDFKKFAFKGNVVDLAVGVVIGAAFQKIVSGVVGNLIMPLVGLVLPDGDWRQAGYVLRDNPDKTKILKLTYGQLMGDALDFLVVALVLFLVVSRVIPALMRKKEEEKVAPAALSKDQELLVEIRDLLRSGATLGKPTVEATLATTEPKPA